MPNAGHEKWDDQEASDDRLNETTHLGGTTSERGTTTKWLTTMPFWDQTLKKWYKNTGTETVPVAVEVGATAAHAAIKLSTAIADYTSPTTATASSSADEAADVDIDGTEFADQAAFDAKFVSSDTAQMRGNPTTDLIDVIFVRDATTDHIYFDLQDATYGLNGSNLSETAWVARFKWNITAQAGTGSSVVGAIGFSSTSAGDIFTNSRDFLGIRIDGAPDNLIRIVDADGVTIGSGNLSASLRTLAVETLYVEMVLLSDTSFKVTLFTDSTFATSGGTATVTVVNTIDALRYFLITNGNSTSTTRTITQTIDNLQIWNGQTTTGLPATNVRDDKSNPTTLIWKSKSEVGPWIRVDMNAIMLTANIAIHLDRTATTATQIKLRTAKTVGTWTDKRLINVSDLTDDAWEFRGFEVANARYLEFLATDAGGVVLAVNEIAVRKWSTAEQLADYDEIHVHQDISATDTSLSDQGW